MSVSSIAPLRFVVERMSFLDELQNDHVGHWFTRGSMSGRCHSSVCESGFCVTVGGLELCWSRFGRTWSPIIHCGPDEASPRYPKDLVRHVSHWCVSASSGLRFSEASNRAKVWFPTSLRQVKELTSTSVSDATNTR